MLLDQLKNDLVSSMKAGDTNRTGTLRFLIAAIRNAAIDKYGSAGEASVTDKDVEDTVKKQVKSHKESIEAFKNAGRQDLVDKESSELDVLLHYLPAQMTDDELTAVLTPIAASGETNFGLLMAKAMAAVQGKADGGRVSATLKNLLKPA